MSKALDTWLQRRSSELDELLHAHAQVGGTNRGRRYLTQQLNHAFAAAVCGQFQGFARDLHVECAELLARHVAKPLDEPLRIALGARLRLNRENPRPEVLREDFSRFGIELVLELKRNDREDWVESRLRRLGDLVDWRNAHSHQDFVKIESKGLKTDLAAGKLARRACSHIASGMDEALRRRLIILTGLPPW